MGIDFDALVMGPCQDTFAIKISIQPDKSQPGEPAYIARGIFDSRDVDVEMQDGQVLSDQVSTFGLRASEFAVAPLQGDRVTPLEGMRAGVTFFISDVDDDGQAGLIISITRTSPAEYL